MTTSDAHDLHDVLLEYRDEVYPHEEYASTHVGLRKKVLDFAGKEGGLKILDLCCATGRALSLFSAARDANLVGVEIMDCGAAELGYRLICQTWICRKVS